MINQLLSKDIAPIIYDNCISCHRPGQIAPMSLTTYEEVRPWARAIKAEVLAGRMPPWHADPDIGRFANASNLTRSEISAIRRWVDLGAPEGDSSESPPAPQFTNEWTLGQPDSILQMPLIYEIPPTEEDYHCCFPTERVPEDIWVQGIEFRPGNPAVNHHVTLFLDAGGEVSKALDDVTTEPGYPCYGGPGFSFDDIVGVWTPGKQPDLLPSGIARFLPKNSRIVMQVHYHGNGRKEFDRSRVGLFFSPELPKKRLRIGLAIDFLLQIPAGDEHHISSAFWVTPAPVELRAIFPHSHLLAKRMTVSQEISERHERKLLEIPSYDFNWQRSYELLAPIRLPEGSRIKLESVFDNSAENPKNPNSPPRDVEFGFDTTDEMNVAIFHYTLENENLREGKDEQPLHPIVYDLDAAVRARLIEEIDDAGVSHSD